jgi:hypothetical protein
MPISESERPDKNYLRPSSHVCIAQLIARVPFFIARIVARVCTNLNSRELATIAKSRSTS